MRLYLRRVFVWCLFTCALLLSLNVYTITLHQWRIQDAEERPRGTDYNSAFDGRADGGTVDANGLLSGNGRPIHRGGFVETVNKFHDHLRTVHNLPKNTKLKNDVINVITVPNIARSGILTEDGIGERIAFNHDEYTIHSDPGKVWPTGRDETRDRIVSQLHYLPPLAKENKKKNKLKTILVYNGLGGTPHGRKKLLEDKCLVDTCHLTDDSHAASTADAILFQGSIQRLTHKRPASQVWILFYLESPRHTQDLENVRDQVNWTATYRRDSTIVAPYERFTPFRNLTELPLHAKRNYAAGKTKKVAWFVSNCGASNGRQQYAEELGRHIQVDIYGACGPHKCSRHQANQCFEMLNKDYKFYLSFENSNCVDYITEKLYWNGYLNDVVPIVLGARPGDYQRSSPPRSYIHVDDFASPKELAEYLHKVDSNDDLYNEFFRWKGSGEFLNTKFWCRLCAMLHDTSRVTWYKDVHSWWHGDTCIKRGHWDHSKHKSKPREKGGMEHNVKIQQSNGL